MVTMKATLMLMLILGAVGAAHGHKLSCENQCEKPIKVNGVLILAKLVVEIEVRGQVVIEVVDVTGVTVFGKFRCPKDVTPVVVVYESGLVKLKLKAAGLIVRLIGLVLGLFQCDFY